MEQDPKFGYHIYWMVPLYWIVLPFAKTYHAVKNYFTKYRPKHTTELDRLRKLAGIDETVSKKR